MKVFKNPCDYFWSNTYPAKVIHKVNSKTHQSQLRRLSVIIPTTIGAALGAAAGTVMLGLFGYVSGGIFGYVVGGFFLGALELGTKIGGTIGLGIGGIKGLHIGAQAGGFIFSNIAKQAARLTSAIFNSKEVNPTNPNKYKLTKQESDQIYRTLKTSPAHASANSQAQQKTVTINRCLAQCYHWKKTHVKPNLFLRVVGLPFFNSVQEKLNQDIDIVVKDLKQGKMGSYDLLQRDDRVTLTSIVP